MVGRVLLKFLLIVTTKARVNLVIFRGKHRKKRGELFYTITNMSNIKFHKNEYAETGKLGGFKYVGVQDRALKLYPDTALFGSCQSPLFERNQTQPNPG